MHEKLTYVTSTSQSYYQSVGVSTMPSWINLEGNKIAYFDDVTVPLKVYGIESKLSFLPKDDDYCHASGKKAKFWRKGMCFYNAVRRCNTKYLVWIDSDVVIHKKFNIEQFLPSDREIATCICPDGWHTETGFVIVNTENHLTKRWISEYRNYWYNGKLSTLRRPWDGAVFYDSIQKYDYRNLYKRESDKKPAGFTDTPLLEYMTHYSGKRRKELIGTAI